MPKFETSAILQINPSKEIGEKQFSVYGSRGCQIRPIILWLKYTNEPVSSKRYKLACAHIEDSDQTAQMRSLIRAYDWRSMGSQGSNGSEGGKLRFRLDYVDAQTGFESSLHAHANLNLLSWLSALIEDTYLILTIMQTTSIAIESNLDTIFLVTLFLDQYHV